MWIVVLLAAGIVVGLLTRLALRPIATLVALLRVFLFFIATALLVVTWATGTLKGDGGGEVVAVIVAAYGAWALTFLVPGVLRLLFAPRVRERGLE